MLKIWPDRNSLTLNIINRLYGWLWSENRNSIIDDNMTWLVSGVPIIVCGILFSSANSTGFCTPLSVVVTRPDVCQQTRKAQAHSVRVLSCSLYSILADLFQWSFYGLIHSECTWKGKKQLSISMCFQWYMSHVVSLVWDYQICLMLETRQLKANGIK